jgi:hypothetical protein
MKFQAKYNLKQTNTKSSFLEQGEQHFLPNNAVHLDPNLLSGAKH